MPKRPGTTLFWCGWIGDLTPAMLYPYAEFLMDFDRKHAAMVHQNCPENTRAAILVETRPHFFVPKVIRNVMYFLGPRWNLHIMSSEHSHGYLHEALRGWNVGITKVPSLGLRIARHDYRAMKLSRDFWMRFRESKLLIFEVDSLLSGPNVEDFIDYDFVGAPCGFSGEQYAANGGLSLRTRQVMLDCLSRFTPEPGIPEDVFFTNAVRNLGGKMPDYETATRFSVESIYTAHPVGVHGTDKYYHSAEVAEKITRSISY
jgi:hypothetical protein